MFVSRRSSTDNQGIEITGDSEIHNLQKYTEHADLIITTVRNDTARGILTR